MIDTRKRLDIFSSPWKYLGLGLLSAGMTALSGAIAFGVIGNSVPGGFVQFIGYVGLIFFGLCAALIGWRGLSETGPVVTMGPDGIRDVRVAPEFIPWTAISDISTWSHSGQSVMVLSVDPEVEQGLSLTRIARWTRAPNAVLGASGLCVTAQGLKADYETLLAITMAYADAAWADAEERKANAFGIG